MCCGEFKPSIFKMEFLNLFNRPNLFPYKISIFACMVPTFFWFNLQVLLKHWLWPSTIKKQKVTQSLPLGHLYSPVTQFHNFTLPSPSPTNLIKCQVLSFVLPQYPSHLFSFCLLPFPWLCPHCLPCLPISIPQEPTQMLYCP